MVPAQYAKIVEPQQDAVKKDLPKVTLPWSKNRRSCDSCSSFDANTTINGVARSPQCHDKKRIKKNRKKINNENEMHIL